MTAELFLIAPPGPLPEPILAAIRDVAARTEVAALLLPRRDLAENTYKTLVKAVVPAAQASGIAVLIEGEPGLVRMLGADGLHVSGSLAAVREAVSALKPDRIVGAAALGTRDDAMLKGEAGVDYILFGPLFGAIDPAQREMGRWWAQTMEIPSVLSDPGADLERYDAAGCEFIGLPLPVSGEQP
ncbi:thiamine phosphate synthase [Devosia sp.]|uniref:thiamine phosphate synthase n=1 Tax=Devosia sp. TaxID=1871048 RepID=UPI0035B0610D